MKKTDMDSVCVVTPTTVIVSETDPRKNRKGGPGDRLGWKCTVHLDGRRTSDWFEFVWVNVFIGIQTTTR